MQTRMVPAVTITTTGITITTSGTSASASIPNAGDGSAPRYIRVNATVAAYVKVGKGSATAVAGDVLVQPGDPVYLVVAGNDKIAAIQVSAAGTVVVNPLEDQ